MLSAAVNDHVAELELLAGLDVQLVQLVHGLLEVQGGLDGQVDGPSQGDEVGLRGVYNRLFLALLFFVLIVGGAVGARTVRATAPTCSDVTFKNILLYIKHVHFSPHCQFMFRNFGRRTIFQKQRHENINLIQLHCE